MLDINHGNSGGAVAQRPAAYAAAWNYAGYFFRALVNLGLTAYIARRIQPSEYGLFLFVMALSATLYLLDLGMSYLLVQFYVDALTHAATERLRQLLWTAFIALVALGTLGLLLFSGLALLLPGPFNIPRNQLHEAATIFVIAGLLMQIALPTMAIELLYQASNSFDELNIIEMANVAATFVLSLFVIGRGFGIIGLAWVQLVMAAFQLTFLAARAPSLASRAGVHSLRPISFRWAVLRELFQKSRWAFIHNLTLYGADLLTWAIITSFTSLKAAALFGIAGKLPRQLWNLVDRGANVLLPIFSRSALQQDEQALRTTLLTVLKVICGALLPFVFLGCLFARPILQLWAGGRYLEAAPVLRWLLIAAYAHGIGYPSDELLYAVGKADKSAQISIWTAILGTAAALLLVFPFGVTGVAAGMAIVRIGTNCFWFTREAARETGTPARKLLSAIFNGLALPLITLVFLSTCLLSVSARISLIAQVLAAVAVGALTLCLWSYRTALPLLKTRQGLRA
ncbi:MAG TPA: oligosaccharide flippase family protein [Terracidiphilus sp.]|nr:oligosaccharide flippase family protein [Terracidiphilus sp.]